MRNFDSCQDPLRASLKGTMAGHVEEIPFWSRQLTEHCLFLHWMLQDEPYRQRTWQLYQEWEIARRHIALTPDAAPQIVQQPLADLARFKEDLLRQLGSGEWLGFAWYTFVRHVLDELLLFERRIWGPDYAGNDLAKQALQLTSEHAAFVAHLLDPMEKPLIEQASATANKLAAAAQAPTPESAREPLAVNQWLAANNIGMEQPRPQSLIPKILAEHVVREHEMFAKLAAESSLQMVANPHDHDHGLCGLPLPPYR